MSGLYRTCALILFNCLLLFIVANLVALPFISPGPRPYDPKAHRDWWLARHGIETMRRVYPGLSDQQIEQLLLQVGHFGLVFEPYIHTKSEPMVLEHTAFHPSGFRLIGREQGPWPMAKDVLNVFVFGGSTIVGSGVRDEQAIPAVLQALLRKQIGDNAVNVYNFATAGHYSTQERIFFEQLIMHGQTPDVVVFMDGLNDFYFWNDEPAHTGLMREAYTFLMEGIHPRSLDLALRTLVQRLPLTNILLPYYYHLIHTGQMPTAALAGAAYANENEFADRSKIDPVIERYFRFKQMAEAVAQTFGVTPIFVWQPVPLYKYDPKLRLFPVVGDHLRHEFGYPIMAQIVAERDLGTEFVWCADAFEAAMHPMYIDSVHYTIEGNEVVAGCAARAITQRGLLEAKLKKLLATRK
jgi:lysophospholipase L1-like esterase